MNRNEAGRIDESQALRRVVDLDPLTVRSHAPRENIDMSQLRVLCIGMAGMIVADALVLIYFWTI